MTIEVKRKDDRVLVALTGIVDDRITQELKQYFNKLRASLPREVIFDFSRLTRIQSAGIGQLLLFYKDMKEAGGVIRLEKVPPTIFDLFHALKLDTLFAMTKA